MIKKEDFNGYAPTAILASESKKAKRLKMHSVINPRGIFFEVVTRGISKYHGKDFEKAIAVYNKI